LLTGCRSSEVAGIKRSELSDLDAPDKAAWLVPAVRSKNGRAHFVPLSGLARETILSALKLISEDEEYLFPSPVDRGGPVTGHALTVAMRRMSEKIEGGAAKTWNDDPPSPHDLRRTVATRIASLGVPEEDVAAILNHTRTSVTGRHYDQYQRAAEKRRALSAWAESLQSILSGEKAQ
jgi:integrase